MAKLRDLDPKPQYTSWVEPIPWSRRNQGLAYQATHGEHGEDLGIEDMVQFVDRYLGDEEAL